MRHMTIIRMINADNQDIGINVFGGYNHLSKVLRFKDPVKGIHAVGIFVLLMEQSHDSESTLYCTSVPAYGNFFGRPFPQEVGLSIFGDFRTYLICIP